MSVASRTAFCRIEFFNQQEAGLFVTGNDHLCDALSGFNGKIFLRKVDEQYAHLSPIIGIDGARSVQHRNAPFQCQPAARAYLSLIAFGQGDEKSRWDEPPFHGVQHDRGYNVCPQVHAGTLRSGIRRQRLSAFVDNLYFYHARNKY